MVMIFVVGTADATETFLGFTWAFACIFHFGLWGTVITLWFMTLGDSYDNIILFVNIAEYLKYAGVYGGYGLLFILTLIAGITTSTFPENRTENTMGIVAAILYLVLAGIDIFVQLFFEPEL